MNFETFSELREEFLDNDDSSAENQETDETKFYNEAELLEIQSEIRLLRNFYELANSIEKNSKGEKLLTALSQGLQKAKELKASPKAIIFTESTKTQNYIYKILSTSNHQNKVVLFNALITMKNPERFIKIGLKNTEEQIKSLNQKQLT